MKESAVFEFPGSPEIARADAASFIVSLANATDEAEVGGKARNVRPGESLARSYRLETVYGDGVRVRHDKKSYLIRVGNAINDSKTQ